MGEYTGVLGPIFAPGTVAVAAWAASVNASGGLNCQQVKYVVYDEGGDPARTQSLTRRAVEQDKVIAFVYNGAPIAGQATVDYLQAKQIPVIGEEGGNAWSCVNSMYFTVMSTCDDGTLGNYMVLGKVTPRKDNKVAAITCVEVPYCSFYSKLAASSAQKAGLDLVYSGSVSLTQPDYTSSCLFAQREGASMVVFGGDSSAMTRFMTSCKSVNYRPILSGPGTAFNPDAPATAELQGAWTASGVRVGPANHPGVAEVTAALKKFAPKVNYLGANHVMGWVSAQVFTLALKNVSGNPTSQDLLKGLWSIKKFTAGDMTRPLTYERNGTYKADPRCWFPLEVVNKQWKPYPLLCS